MMFVRIILLLVYISETILDRLSIIKTADNETLLPKYDILMFYINFLIVQNIICLARNMVNCMNLCFFIFSLSLCLDYEHSL